MAIQTDELCGSCGQLDSGLLIVRLNHDAFG